MKPLIKQGLLLAALVAAFAPAQAQSGSAAEHEPGAPVPLVLSVASERVPLGMPITLMGSGPVLADAPPKVKVILPDGRQAEATVTVVAPGRFELSWRDTQRQGRYSFELSLAGQPQTAQAEVEVVTAVAALADARAALDGAVEAAEKGLRALDQRLAKLPPSPARDAGRAKLKAYSDGTAVHHAHLRQTLERLDGLAKAGKDMPVSLGALGRRLQPSLALTRERRGIIEAQLARSAQDDILCEQMERVTEGLNLASALLNLVAEPLGILVNFAKDMDSGALASWASSDPEKQFIDKEIAKNLGAAEPVLKATARGLRETASVARDEAIKSLPGLAADASALSLIHI